MRIRLYWLYVFLILTVGIFFFYQSNQPHLSYDLAPEFDGNDYGNSYEYFSGDLSVYEVAFPFHQRIFVPLLAAQINSGDIVQDFQWVNLFFTLLSVIVLFLLWQQLGYELKWFWFGFIWLLFHWTGMIRLNALDPITVDLPLYLFQTLLLLFLLKRKFIHLLWLGPLATTQKESFIALLVVIFIYGLWYNWKTKEPFYDMPLIGAALVLSIATQAVISYYFPPLETGKGALITLGYHAKQVLLDPFELIRWLAAVGVAFGPLFFISSLRLIKLFRIDNTRLLLLVLSLTYLSFGLLAGGDMTRIIFLGFPFVMTWLLWESKDMEGKKFILASVLSLPLFFFWKTIPDPAFQWELWESWYPEFAKSINVILTIGYLFFAVLILMFNSTRTKAAEA